MSAGIEQRLGFRVFDVGIAQSLGEIPFLNTIAAALDATLAPVALVATAQLKIASVTAATLDAITDSATGALLIAGALGGQLDPVALAATGTLKIVGVEGGTLDPVTLSATGQLVIQGTEGGTLDPIALVATGEFKIVGVASDTIGAIDLAAEGTLPIAAALDATLAPVTSLAPGEFKILAALDATLAPITLDSTATLRIAGDVARTIGAVALTTFGGTPGATGAPPILYGGLAVVGQTFGLLQLIGIHTMIDLIGPMRVFRGDAATYRLTVTDDTDARVDLTGASIKLTVRTALGSTPPAIYEKAIGTGVALLSQLGDTKGQADITVSSVDTDHVPGVFWLDVLVVTASSRSHVIAPREYSIADVVGI